MIHLNTPNGLKASVPENRNEDDTPRFDINYEFIILYYVALKILLVDKYMLFNNQKDS